MLFTLALCIASPGRADDILHGHPNRGTTTFTLLLCRFSNGTAVSSLPTVSSYQNTLFADNPARLPGTGSMKEYFNDISGGQVALTGSVHGWYTEPRTKEIGNTRGKLVNQDCIDAAIAGGYTPPAGSIVGVILADTNPGEFGGRYHTTDYNPLGYQGWILADPFISFATLAHEIGHSLDLSHSFSREPSLGDVQYGDPWDLMSNPQGSRWPAGLNGPNLDRIGWLPMNQIVTVGADGGTGGTYRLKPLYSTDPGVKLLRVPAGDGNPFHYFTVEFRTKAAWDSGISTGASSAGIVLIHLVLDTTDYLLLDANVQKSTCQTTCNVKFSPPCQNICSTTTSVVAPGVPVQRASLLPNWNTSTGSWLISVSGVSSAGADVTVNLPSSQISTARSMYGPNTCSVPYVWRQGDYLDYVCVDATVRSQTYYENLNAPIFRSPTGGPWGPDTCLTGYVWRDAFPVDHVCVLPASRTQAANDNKHAAERLMKP